MGSTLWYNLCGIGYFLALFLYIANLVAKKSSLRKAATVATALSFLFQTVGMLFRWREAGDVEVEAAERATGLTLTGWTHFVVYTQHPPWSNLYEILVFMSWGIVLAFLVSEVKFRIRLMGIFALLIALISFGLASLTTDATIKPLVPALQSWWIMIHVISSAIGYAAGTLGAVASLLYLVKAKDRIGLQSIAGGTMAISTLLFFILGRGAELFTTGTYRVKLLREMGDDFVPVGRFIGENFQPYHIPSPGIGPLLIIAIALSGATAIYLYSQRKKSDEPSTIGRILYFTTFGVTTAIIAMNIINNMTQTDIKLPAELAATLMPPAPWRLSMQSNQWDMAMFVIVWAGQLFSALSLLFPVGMRDILPEARRLDRAAYYSIMISFALVAIVLVTGALWAHYAWGRYWGWDPKETGALVIWITYAIYLHTRLTYGWVGVPSSVIGVLGFFVIIAGFLGVNLGWFADGLHSYGAG